MFPFLKEIAIYLKARFPDNLDQIQIVFPNKRAGLFFRQYLSQLADKPIWSPTILDIDSFVKHHSELQVPDKYSLLFDLYEIYREIGLSENGQIESFDNFYPWGKMLLNDFNEIDKYMVEAKDLFKTITDIQTLDSHFDYLTDEQIEIITSFWNNINISKHSDHKESFIKFWDILYQMYNNFKIKLADKKLAYVGMLYRELAEKVQNGELEIAYHKTVFVGFNILNKSEEKIFKFYKNENKGLYFWDFDKFFLEKKNFEPGDLIKKNIKKFPPPSDFKLPSFSSEKQPKKIEFIGVPLEVGQAKVVGDKLNKLSASSTQNSSDNDKKIDNTAVVLPAEHLLFPVLNSLPDTIKDINVTMGYPLKNTQLSSLLELVIDLQQNSKTNGDRISFYYKDVVSILNHPYILFINPKEINKTICKIQELNWIYIADQQLSGLFDFANKVFCKSSGDTINFDYFLEVLYDIYQSQKENKDSLDTEYIYRFYTEINRLKEITIEKDISLSDKIFYKLLKEIIHSIKIPFTGEPLKGLQIMGTLETRCLDFENLFILSMNEGRFPSVSYDGSFIPYNLRRAHELPTFERENSVYAYYFYRLLQRAKNICLLYNTETGDIGEGEMSRYLYQLKYDFDFVIKENILAYSVESLKHKKIVIEKDDRVLKSLAKFLQKDNESANSLSPSAINTYLDCSLRFYFKYIAALYEIEEVQEEVDPMVLGNILHHTMESLYHELIASKKGNTKDIIKEDFNELPGKVEFWIEEAFKKHYGIEKEKFQFHGHNIIMKSIIITYIGAILKLDKDYAPFEIIAIEAKNKNYEKGFEITVNGQNKLVGLKGIIDRIDLKDKLVRVIDYKTGGDEKKFDNIESLFDPENNSRNKAVLQTFFYSMLYKDSLMSHDNKIVPGIYNVKEMFADQFDYRLYMKTGRQKPEYVDDLDNHLDEFKQYLRASLEELFDKTIAFLQTEEEKRCEYCPYSMICHRDINA